MHKWFLSIVLYWVIIGALSAHSPELSSTILKEQENSKWVLVVRAPLTALQYEISTHYGESAYSSPEEFQALVVEHLKENVSIRLNEMDTLTLQKGMVKLGHETNVVFQLVGMPEVVNSLSIKNSSFKDIRRHQSALIVLKNQFSKTQFILDKENQYTAKLIAVDNQFVQYAESTMSKSPSLIYLLVGLLILALGAGLFYRMINRTYSLQ